METPFPETAEIERDGGLRGHRQRKNHPLSIRGLGANGIEFASQWRMDSSLRNGHYTKYEARRMKEGAGWYVVVTSKNGAVQEWFGFVTEAQARAWISNEMYPKATQRSSAS
jgi:hypothetical protein